MFGKYINFIEKNMDVAALNRNVISNNIANYNTPNFKANKVSFEHMFSNQSATLLKKTSEKHITSIASNGEPIVYQDSNTKEKNDGNNVDLNVEMIDMIKNNSYYNKAVQAINKEFYLNKKAIGN